MRAEHLTVQAFGCYLKEIQVDFSSLNSNLFLITGATGGGKTTLLDGICFALYCRATGGRRTWSDMRSIAAPLELPTVVDFSFSLGQERYRFRRSLKIHKVRGNGRLEQRDEHVCWQWQDGNWSLLLSGAESKVREKAQELLGLTCEQFSQVVVLPQGEFRKLLLSSSTEKARIFQTLFQTQRWEGIVKAAQDSAEESRRELEQMFRNREVLLEQEECSDLSQLQEKEEKIRIQTDRLKKQGEELQRRLEQANQEYSQCSVIHECYQQLDQFTEEKERLSQEKEAVEGMRVKWEQARNIRELLPEYRNYKQALLEKEEICKRLERISQQKEQAEKRSQEAQRQIRKIEELHKEWEQCTQTLALLEQGKSHADHLLQIEREIGQAGRKQREQEERWTRIRREKEESSQRVKKGEAFIRQISGQARALPQAMEQLSYLEGAEIVFSRLKEKQKEYGQIKSQWEQAAEEEKAARIQLEAIQEKLTQIEELFSLHSAVRLAVSLEEGKPCPVCGSRQHPHPADKIADIPQEEQRELLRRAAQEAEQTAGQKAQKLAESRARIQVKKEEIQALEKTCQEYSISRAELVARLEEARRRTMECQKAQQQLSLAEKRLEQRREELQKAQEEGEKSQETLHQYANRIAQLQSAYETVLKNFPQGIRTAQQLEEEYQIQNRRQKSLRESIGQLEEQVAQAQKILAQAQEQQDMLRQRAQEQEEKAHRLLQSYQKSCEERNLSSKLSLEDIWIGEEAFIHLEQRIRQYQERVRQVEARLSELEQKLHGTKRPDMQAMQRDLSILRQQTGETSQRAGAFSQSWGRLFRTLQVLQQEEEKSAVLERQWAQNARVAQLLSGNNKRKIPIKMFVLGIMLDDILSRANLYFSAFSDGRYRLIRPEQEAAGRGYGGLDLVVLDGYSGGTRPVETLSGGELFLASLSLAFGLSDVVQGNSGGIRLDSIFIDEGFGSLDQETLDTAMRALDEIRRSGRTVGIISHVQELKYRISTKIEVIPQGDGGSTIRIKM